jgi:thiol-disulfide isomerase/thioredoxin
MKKILALAACLLIGLSAAQAQSLPSTLIKDSMGRKVAFNKTIEPGKVTVISIWATWCIPCKAELFKIKDSLRSWQARTDFNFMSISIDETRSEPQARTYARSQNWYWPNYTDPNNDLKRTLNFQDPPWVLIIDKAGKVVYKHQGYKEGDENTLYEEIQRVVNGG